MPRSPRLRGPIAALIMFEQPFLKINCMSDVYIPVLIFQHVNVVEHNPLEVSLPDMSLKYQKSYPPSNDNLTLLTGFTRFNFQLR